MIHMCSYTCEIDCTALTAAKFGSAKPQVAMDPETGYYCQQQSKNVFFRRGRCPS